MPIGTTTRTTSKGWAGVAAIAAGTFVMVTSEFLPIGLLGSIARDLGVSEGRAGLMVTAPGLVAAITAPALTMTAGRLDRRTILVGLTALILAADLVVATASGLGMVLVGRMLLGGALGGFWALSAAAGRRLVADADGDRATALILGGISVGTVAGVPLGTTLADALGWRSAFLSVGGLAVAVLAAQLIVLPSLPGLAAAGARHLVSVLRNRLVATGYIAAALLASGHFAAYTYLQPFAGGRAHFYGTALTALLAAFGIAGVAGTWIGGVVASRNVRHTFAGVALVLSCAIGLSLAAEDSFWLVGLCVVLWGGAFGAFPVCVQLWLHKAAPTEFESGSALMVTVFQAAVAAGAFAGGLAVDAYDVRIAFALGAAVALLALPVLLLSPRPAAGADPGPAVT
jgi:predicted MFS family arabinose efflux permease